MWTKICEQKHLPAAKMHEFLLIREDLKMEVTSKFDVMKKNGQQIRIQHTQIYPRTDKNFQRTV